MRNLLFSILFSGLPLATIHAASFDCSKARTATEKTICVTPGLYSLDEYMAKNYLRALDVVKDRDAMVAAQRIWLIERDSCGDDSGCILSAYQTRLKELRLCGMRTTKLERFICSQDQLWGLDQAVEREYEEVLEKADEKKATVSAHKAWLEERDICGLDLFCLLNSYEKRLWILRGKYFPLTKDIPKRPYILEKGQGIEVCEAYQDNLNSQHPKGPWKCDRPVNKALPGFEQQPVWEQPHTMPNGKSVYDYYGQMGDLLWERDVNPVRYHTVTEWPHWQGTPEQLESSRKKFVRGRQHLAIFRPPFITTLDIDNDSTPETVYFEQNCSSNKGARLAVLTPDWKSVDRDKTEKLMQHSSFNLTGREVFRPLFEGERDTIYTEGFGYRAIEDAWRYLYYDVFLFRRKAYIDQWWSRHPDFKGESSQRAGRLRVYQVTHDGTKELCSYRFSN